GQERDVILISLVRANDDGQIGFLRDLRRMNVAITRARMKLIILGEAATLTRHPFYRRLHHYISSLHQEALEEQEDVALSEAQQKIFAYTEDASILATIQNNQSPHFIQKDGNEQ
ncbi:MAG: hypothetical protein KBT32_06610, partial [Bacteroidales bacterium]|nr:hypothetical protein [Candidatus Physcocola equi]